MAENIKSYLKLLDKSPKNYTKIPWQGLTFTEMETCDQKGETLLHKVAKTTEGGFLGKIPKKFLCDELLALKTNTNQSVYFLAAQSISLDLIQKDLLTSQRLLEETLLGDTPLLQLIKTEQVDILDRELIESGILLKHSRVLDTTYLHYCAMSGELKKLPKQYIAKHLDYLDHKQENLLHWAAGGEKLGDIDFTQRAIELMHKKDTYGQTPLHHAPSLKGIDKRYLIPPLLSIQDWKGQTPLHKSTWLERTTDLPIEVLTEGLLTIKDKEGSTPLSNILEDYDKETDEKNLPKILKLISTKHLVESKSLDITSDVKKIINKCLAAREIKLKLLMPSNTIEI